MSSIDELLRHPGLWRAREQGASRRASGLPTGYAALDRHLPGGGWPRAGLVEILTDHHGIGELQLLIPALAALCSDEGTVSDDGRDSQNGWLAWIAPPYQPYAPALAACGIDVSRVLVVRAAHAQWAMEQALRSSVCSAVLGWSEPNNLSALRRLQLAAEEARCLAVLFRPSRRGQEPSPAVLRVALSTGPAGLEVQILKSRGSPPASVRLPIPNGVTPS